MPRFPHDDRERFILNNRHIMETLDKFDIAILQELQSDGRLTNAELAQRVGLSAAPCWRRVRALEEAGFIRGYRAEIDREKIGLGVLAFVRLDADRNSGDVTRTLENAIRKHPRGGVLPLHQRLRHLRAAGGQPRPEPLQPVRPGGPAQPAQREGPAHQLLPGRGEVGSALPLSAPGNQKYEHGKRSP
jgi:DNA-binding Lrp family transcriptional regulator